MFISWRNKSELFVSKVDLTEETATCCVLLIKLELNLEFLKSWDTLFKWLFEFAFKLVAQASASGKSRIKNKCNFLFNF